ncbi:retrotransposon protein [Cucumis melo var. makuwa]|uniref:Retrotransposon protein n=1 Tax=Cucumis melo var. makuwa TaxID=1194695 RepID=A0A5A7VDH2_CUCMM|nr:retrotransposon protein [Cucumis melo var. makuwa]
MNDNKRLPQTPRTFAILCHLLRTVPGLSSTEIIDVEEMVAMFLHVLAHNVKNRVIKRKFVRSDETVSRHFNIVLFAVVRLYEELIKRPAPNCLGALDGMYIKVNVPAGDRPTFRTRKGEIATNVLGVCDTKGDFVYVLAGWEGSAADSQILRDALSRENGLQRPVVPFAEWPARTLANDNHVRTEFFCILREMPELMSLDRRYCKDIFCLVWTTFEVSYSCVRMRGRDFVELSYETSRDSLCLY